MGALWVMVEAADDILGPFWVTRSGAQGPMYSVHLHRKLRGFQDNPKNGTHRRMEVFVPVASDRSLSRRLFLRPLSSRWSWRSTAVSAWETRECSRAATRCSREEIDASLVSTLSVSRETSTLTVWMSRRCVSSTRRIKASMSCLVDRACKSARISPFSRLMSSLGKESSVSGGSGWKSTGVSDRESKMEGEAGDAAGSSMV